MNWQMNWEYDYLDLLGYVKEKGEFREDRTGVGTKSLFAVDLDIYLSNSFFPLVTTKKVPFKSVLSELLWFIEGSGDERRLAEILHGTRDPAKKTIWSPNAEATSGSKFQPQYEGDLGRVYGVQWRSWSTGRHVPAVDKDGHTWQLEEEIDQLAEVISQLRTNPTSRRIIMSAWNPGELGLMALPPCHMMVQFYLSNDRKLSAHMYQRSADLFLGVPFNIASYSLFLTMIAKVIDAEPGRLRISFGDIHIYRNHFEQVEEQLSRNPLPPPKLEIANRKEIDDFKMEDFKLIDYNCHAAITAPMAA